MSLLPLAAALLATGPGLTPDGPATLRATIVAPLPYARFGPRVVVRWRVEVGEGGAGGPVALRVLSGDPSSGHAYGRGQTEQLPAAPGAHEFPARLRILDGQRIGLDQQTGGHAIPMAADERLHAVDIWQPPLGVGESRAAFERRSGEALPINITTELDVDEDGYGDTTQDENDLAIRARPGRRSVRVILRNRGDRVVDRPHVRLGRRVIDLRPIAPRGTRRVLVHGLRRGFRVKLIAGSEGFDPTPASVVARGR